MKIAETLRARGLAPKRSFGQNFLANETIAEAIALAATPEDGGTVLEIGAGLGALTRPLAARASRVVAVERDRDLVPVLRELLADAPGGDRVELLEADAVTVDWEAALAGPPPHVAAGNLPYQITGRLLELATRHASRLDRCVFMVQAEVADRLAAAPATSDYGALSVFVQAAFRVERLMTVRAGSFYPRPDVDSAVVALHPHHPRRAEETDAFRDAVRAAFSMRRKTLRNAWRDLYGWSREELERAAAAAGISLDARGETLSVEDFARLASQRPF